MPLWQSNMILVYANLWKQIVTYSRLYLNSVSTDSGEQEYVYDRLYKIPTDFGNSVRGFFGDEIAEQYKDLLGLHILLIKNLIDSQVQQDAQAVQQNINLLYDNANRIAALLARANPFWIESEVRNLLYTYISLLIEENYTFLSKDYEKSIDAFDRLLAYSTVLGSYFAQGLYTYLVATQTKTE